MILFPAIDLYEGKAVRLYKGNYDQMTVYSDHPEEVAADFAACGATHIHLVDLEGARSGKTPNLDTVLKIRENTGLFCEIGGGIRNMETVDRYLSAGLVRQPSRMKAFCAPQWIDTGRGSQRARISGTDMWQLKDGQSSPELRWRISAQRWNRSAYRR